MHKHRLPLFILVFTLSLSSAGLSRAAGDDRKLFFSIDHTGRESPETAGYFNKAEPGDPLGYRAWPARRVRSARIVGGRTVYDAVYSMDPLGRRATPQGRYAGEKKYFLFFGCSSVFGEGVGDGETLPACAARAVPRYAAYNYGFPGYGPHQMLARLQAPSFRGEIPERQGVACYFFIDHHVNRAIGALSASWGENTPCYELSRDGTVARKGSFRSAHPFRSFLFRMLNASGLLPGNVDIPRLRESHFRLTARILVQARDEYARRFGNDRFYVVFYPGNRYAARLIPWLRSAGVRYIDYSGRDDLTGEGFAIPEDGHPTPRFYREMAALLVRDLGLEAARDDRPEGGADPCKGR